MVLVLGRNSVTFPAFANFIHSDIPEAVQVPKIWNAMLDCAGILWWTSKAMDARTWMLPMVMPEIVPTLDSRLDFNRVAEYRFKDPWKIYISMAVVAKFEAARSGEGITRARRFMRGTILHEMVHFLDFWADGAFLDADIVNGALVHKEDSKERGHRFEKMAFGGTASAVEPWN